MDSRWVLYASEPNNRQGLFKLPTEGGEPVLLVDKSTFSHALSPDGKSVAYVHRPPELNAKAQIEIVSIEDGSIVKVFDAPEDVGRLRWSPDSSALDFVRTEDEISNVWRLAINGGQLKQLTFFESDLIFSFAWSFDGKQLAATRGSNDIDLVLIEDLVSGIE